jgi:flagellum-specific ATP synthase
VLSRDLATQNHYPAIDVLGSVSRLERDLLQPAERELAGRAREAMAIYRKNQDLITIGAYPQGSNATIDHAIQAQDSLQGFLRQPVNLGFKTAESWKLLESAMATAAARTKADKPATRNG